MLISVDTGGTFTDCVYLTPAGLRVLKLASTPGDPGAAILDAVQQIAGDGLVEVRHGTTVGTNALLERTGARVAFVTTAGFEDTIAIGRQARPKLYDLFFQKPEPLAPERLRFGVKERVAADGTILQAVSDEELSRLRDAVAAGRPESIAVSLLFAFANPENEQAVCRTLAEIGVPVSASHKILPEFREYERASTILINAYLAPKMQTYLGSLAQKLSLSVMQSSGGIIDARLAAEEPVRTILSGPAGGVVGAMHVAKQAGFPKALAFDMGGTSTDVALIDSERGLETTTESQIQGMPVAVPVLRIHTVGAGGGSLASFDAGGALKVGPESAGAVPGPVCYGRGTQPTVTDANLILGRLDPSAFLGGGMQLDTERTREALQNLRLSIEAFAEGIVALANSHMVQALRKISVEQGHDPRDFTLVSYGGAGPLHACDLAQALQIPRVLIPNFPPMEFCSPTSRAIIPALSCSNRATPPSLCMLPIGSTCAIKVKATNCECLSAKIMLRDFTNCINSATATPTRAAKSKSSTCANATLLRPTNRRYQNSRLNLATQQASQPAFTPMASGTPEPSTRAKR
jgi:N-methylhydantoinase A